MEKEKLRTECLRLIRCDTMSDCHELIDIYSDFIFKVIINYQMDEVDSNSKADAKIVLQMIFTKLLNLKQVTKGIAHTTKDGTLTLKNIVDPTIVACLIRNAYETISIFNLIYVNTKTDDERVILYNLWCISGLKNRQKFERYTKSLADFEDEENYTPEQIKISELHKIQIEKNKEKLELEKHQINKYLDQIKQTNLYKSLNQEGIRIIDEVIKKKDYKIKFSDGKVVKLIWQDLTNVMQIKEGLMDDIYTYFSLYSHPSNVSVFQFADLYKVGEEYFAEMTNFQLKNLFMLTSIFIADYIKLFPNVLETFNRLDIKDQIIINYHNTFARGNTFSINNSHLNLD